MEQLEGPFAEADARLAGETGTAAAFIKQLLGPAQLAAAKPITLESIPRLPLPGIAIGVLSCLSLSPAQGLLLPALLGEVQRRTERLDAVDEEDLRSFMSLPGIVPPIGVSQAFSTIMQRIFEEVMVAAALAMATGKGN